MQKSGEAESGHRNEWPMIGISVYFLVLIKKETKLLSLVTLGLKYIRIINDKKISRLQFVFK